MRVLPSALAAALVSVLFAAAPVSAAPPPEPRSAVIDENQVTRVVVISVDGLNPDAITQLGESGAPTFHRIVDEGATTFNARSEVEMTNTLPNHTGMVTSRRIDLATGGHGVTWNDDRLVPRTVELAAGQQVGSVFSSLDAAGLSSSLFAAKGKFGLFNRSWPNGVDHTLIRGNNALAPGFTMPPARSATMDHISFGITPFDPDAVAAALCKRGLVTQVDTGATASMPPAEHDIHTATYKSYHTRTPNNFNLQFSSKITADKRH